MTHPHRRFPASFALISVLALVSLATLTATAFLASARLERLATRSLSQTTQLEMALTAGERCAEQIIGDAIQPSGGANFVTTLWRGTGPTDYTNELGYLFIGQPAFSSATWTYYAGFSPATLTNLDTNDIQSFIRWPNTHQGAFTNECSTYMAAATNGFSTNPAVAATSKVCTLLPLLGGRTSPPVGWVYLKQERRIFGTTTTTNLPVARCAWFLEDLSGMIDVQRMGAATDRTTGTNPEEISLINMTRLGGGPNVLTKNGDIADITNRKLFFTPSLIYTNAGLTNTNDLRYFASGLREWRPTNKAGDNGTVAWIPSGIFAVSNSSGANKGSRGYGNSGYLKMDINRAIASKDVAGIANFIKDTLPDFTNRAGGMNGDVYLSALAANMIDYADADSLPTITTTNGQPIAGFDAYPLPTIIFDRFSYASATKTLTVDTYLQLWNCSTKTSPAVTMSFSNGLQDTYSNNTTPMQPNGFTDSLPVPSLDPGAGVVLTVNHSINLSSVINSSTNIIWIDGNAKGQFTKSNTYSLSIGGQVVSQLRTGFERKAKSVDAQPTNWSGGMPGLRYDNVAGINTSFKVPPSGDPRMCLYFTNANPNGYLSACDYDQNVEWGLGYARTRRDAFAGNPYSGTPANWFDGSNTNGDSNLGTPYPDATAPTLGTFLSKTLPSARLSTNANGLYTNICELGNIFDPIQWVSTTITKPNQWVNCDIDSSTLWSTNSMYGGGQTLRIGRPEHSRFAFTNLGTPPASQPIPNMGRSAVALLDLFCINNPDSVKSTGIYRTGGKINLNTAPAPVLAALAGGITLSKDPKMTGSPANATMISDFTNGVMRFRSLYPFLTPSQLAFISTTYGQTGWTNTAQWSANTVFSASKGLAGVTSFNDEAREEWFAKIYELASVSSVNYRVYLAAQLVDTNGNATGPIVRKYCQYAGRPDTTTGSSKTISTYAIPLFSWARTTGQKKVYESPY